MGQVCDGIIAFHMFNGLDTLSRTIRENEKLINTVNIASIQVCKCRKNVRRKHPKVTLKELKLSHKCYTIIAATWNRALVMSIIIVVVKM